MEGAPCSWQLPIRVPVCCPGQWLHFFLEDAALQIVWRACTLANPLTHPFISITLVRRSRAQGGTPEHGGHHLLLMLTWVRASWHHRSTAVWAQLNKWRGRLGPWEAVSGSHGKGQTCPQAESPSKVDSQQKVLPEFARSSQPLVTKDKHSFLCIHSLLGPLPTRSGKESPLSLSRFS